MAIPPRNKRKASSSPERQTQSPEPPQNAGIPSSSSSSAADNFSSPPLVFPPGYKFLPSDEELILHYLKPFSQGNQYSLLNVPIHHVNIYESNPEQLAEMFGKGNEKEWFFVSEISKVSTAGKNKKRCDINGGCWSATTAGKKFNVGQDVVGCKTSLEYCVGKPPNSEKGDWLMQEYLVESSNDNNKKVDHALCKIYLTPKAAKKKKAEEEENKKLKKAEEEEKLKKEVALVIKEEAEQMDLYQPDQSQLDDIVYQSQQLPFWHNVDDLSGLIGFEQQSGIPEDIWNYFIGPHSLNRDEESNNSGFFWEAWSKQD